MFSFKNVHPSWQAILQKALTHVDPHYMQALEKNPNWLPGSQQIFNTFSLPLDDTRYILLGESPYPRAESANGYAFWDNAVKELWSDTGLSKKVNRATSLRNMIKMLLVSQNLLDVNDTSQKAIQALDKSHLVNNINDLFNNFLSHGFLLLNASLALGNDFSVQQHAKMWLPFLNSILSDLSQQKLHIELILFGNIAKIIQKMPVSATFTQLIAEHPYNLSFISNAQVLNFFKSFHLLNK